MLIYLKGIQRKHRGMQNQLNFITIEIHFRAAEMTQWIIAAQTQCPEFKPPKSQ